MVLFDNLALVVTAGIIVILIGFMILWLPKYLRKSRASREIEIAADSIAVAIEEDDLARLTSIRDELAHRMWDLQLHNELWARAIELFETADAAINSLTTEEQYLEILASTDEATRRKAIFTFLARSGVESWAMEREISLRDLRNQLGGLVLSWIGDFSSINDDEVQTYCTDYVSYLGVLDNDSMRATIMDTWNDLIGRSFAQPTLAQYGVCEYPAYEDLLLFATEVCFYEELSKAKWLLAYYNADANAREFLSPVMERVAQAVNHYNYDAGLRIS